MGKYWSRNFEKSRLILFVTFLLHTQYIINKGERWEVDANDKYSRENGNSVLKLEVPMASFKKLNQEKSASQGGNTVLQEDISKSRGDSPSISKQSTFSDKKTDVSNIVSMTPTIKKSLPNVPYNHEELEEIIEEIPMASEIKTKVDGYLENIEKQVAAIQRYQAKQHPENFYGGMRTALLEIRNTANAIYELIKPYHS